MPKRTRRSAQSRNAEGSQRSSEPSNRDVRAPGLGEDSAHPWASTTWSATTVTIKGQVTVPKRIRDHLGVAAGSAVQFEIVESGDVVLRRAGKAAAPSRFERFRGKATAGLTTDEIMAMTRGDD